MTTFSHSRLETIVSRIACLDRKFVLTKRDEWTFTLHVEYMEKDVDDPDGPETLQQSRKWMINWDDSETDIVETAFACVMRSYDHVVKEHFTFDGLRVHSPHFTLKQRIDAAMGVVAGADEKDRQETEDQA